MQNDYTIDELIEQFGLHAEENDQVFKLMVEIRPGREVEKFNIARAFQRICKEISELKKYVVK